MEIPNQSKTYLTLPSGERKKCLDSCGPLSAGVLLSTVGMNYPIDLILSTSIQKGWYSPNTIEGTTPEALLSLLKFLAPHKKIGCVELETLSESEALSLLSQSLQKGKKAILLIRTECGVTSPSHFVNLLKIEKKIVTCADTYSHLLPSSRGDSPPPEAGISSVEEEEWVTRSGEWSLPFSRVYQSWSSLPDGKNKWVVFVS